MEKKDFYDYAVKSNLTGTQYQNEEVVKMRDNRLKAECGKVVEAANYIIDNGFPTLKFEMCLNSRFYIHEYNWAQIYIPKLKLYLFFVDNSTRRDIIFQLYGHRINLLIFDIDVNMDYIGSEIVRKIGAMEERKKQYGK